MFETVCSKQRIIDDSDTQESFYIKTIDKKPQFSLTNVISEVDSRKEYRKMLHDQFQQA